MKFEYFKGTSLRKCIGWEKEPPYKVKYVRYSVKERLLGIPSVIRPYFYIKFFPKGNLVRLMVAIGRHTFMWN